MFCLNTLSTNNFFCYKNGFVRNFTRIFNSNCIQSKLKMDLNSLQRNNGAFFSTAVLRQNNMVISSACKNKEISKRNYSNIIEKAYSRAITKIYVNEQIFKRNNSNTTEKKYVRAITKTYTPKSNTDISIPDVEISGPILPPTMAFANIVNLECNKLLKRKRGESSSEENMQMRIPYFYQKRNCSTNVEIDNTLLPTRDRNTKKSKTVKSDPVSLNDSQIKEILYEEGEAVQNTLKLFPVPKNVIHNTYQLLTDELKQPFRISPTYRLLKDQTNKSSIWICMYHVKWPEEIKFYARDFTKKFASHKAALAALTWLKQEGKINEKGFPILYDKNVVKTLTNKTVPKINLTQNDIETMNEITNVFQMTMLPLIQTDKDVIDVDAEDKNMVSEPDYINLNVKKQRYIGLEKYLAKEKVVLPIASYKQNFIDTLRSNRVVIVKGEPGCGKSTRVPQYVLEDWAKQDGLYGNTGRIAVTQPRRIAAISLAQRVANERNEMVGHIVGYQVRLNSRFQADTGRILYCTTGILLRQLQSDSNLLNFSHIILDEAHERDVNTDLLMNLIKRALDRNPALKLVIMSATIDTDMFSEYFDGAPVLEIPGFTYPVKQRFLDNCKINVSKTLKMCEGDIPTVIHEDVVRVLEYIHNNQSEGAILCFLPGWEDINKIYRMIPVKQDIAVYCLHSRLQDSEQWKIFSRPPPGIRKIILSTNIAETSVTIDDVVYVVDTGMQKEQRFDAEKGINCIDCHWISKANVTQRKGRAGRVQPGECYHMYTQEKFDSFSEYALPEIQRTSLSKILLDCKVFSNNMNALEFMGKLPTPPAEEATIAAVNELTDLELLDNEEKLTSLGRTLANFQLEPKLSKALVNSVIYKCVTPIIDIITIYSAETEFFTSGLYDKEGAQQVKTKFCNNSDHLAMMRVFEKWLELKEEMDTMKLRRFCGEANLIQHKMETIEKLRKIHFDYLYNGLYNALPIADDFSDNDELVKAILFSGIGKVLKHRNWDIVKGRLKTNVNVFLTRHNHKATISMESVNCKKRKYPTNYLLYINEIRSNIRRATLVRECSLIPEIAVLLFSNKKLRMEEVEETEIDNDLVNLVLDDTNIKFICDRVQAQSIIKCKEALNNGYQYYIRNLTEAGVIDPEVNEIWDNILSLLNDLLLKHSV